MGQSRDAARRVAPDVERWAAWVPLAILGYFALQAALRLALSSNLEIDEAPIAEHAGLALGYGNSHPPLYDWIVVLLHRLVGSWPLAFALAKNGLLAAAYLCFYAAGRILFATRAGGAVLALSLLLMPQIAWQSQVTLAHSTLATAASAALIAALVFLTERVTWPRALAFGFALAAALLSKYSVLIPIAGLAAAILGMREARARLADRRVAAGAALGLAIAAPHYLWALANPEATTARLVKLAKVNPLWSRVDLPLVGIDGLISLSASLAASAGLLVLLWAIGRRLARDEADAGALPEVARLWRAIAGRALACGLALAAAGVLLGDVHDVPERYLTPLLMLLPLWLGLRFPIALKPGAVRRFLLLSAALAILITAGWPQLALFGHHRFAYPYEELSRQVADLAGPEVALLMRRTDYATNFRLRMPGARLFDPASPAATVAVLWEGGSDRGRTLLQRAGPCYRAAGPPREIAAPYHYFSGNEARLTLAVLRAAPAAACMAAAPSNPRP